MTLNLVIEESHQGHQAGLERLFCDNTVGCYCRFWHFDGWEIEWMERCTEPARNREELEHGLRCNSVDARGLVAMVDSLVVGWLKLAPASTLDKLYGRRPYGKMPCFAGDRSGVFTIGCVLVDAAWRRRGIARALIHEGVRTAARRGATSIEALPRDGATDPCLLQMGPARVFRDAGFEVVDASVATHPVMRKVL